MATKTSVGHGGADATYTVRLVDDWSVDDIVELYREGGWWQDGYDPTHIPDLIGGSLAFAVAIDGRTGRAVGMGRAFSDGVSDAYVQDVVVLTAHRRNGLGRRIVQALLERLRERHIGWVGVIAQEGTSPFYARLGFVPMKNHVPMLLGPNEEDDG